jgi:hypothetical protein
MMQLDDDGEESHKRTNVVTCGENRSLRKPDKNDGDNVREES